MTRRSIVLLLLASHLILLAIGLAAGGALVANHMKPPPAEELGRFRRHIKMPLTSIIEDYENSDCDYVEIEVHADGFAGVRGKKYGSDETVPLPRKK